MEGTPTEETPTNETRPAYVRMLSEAERAKIESLAVKMHRLDDTYHVWVRDANDAPLPIAEIRDQIQERYEAAGLYTPDVDPPLRLLFGGKTLVDGHRLSDYLPLRPPFALQSLKWAKPYAGMRVIWVVPIEVETHFVKNWGDSVGLPA
ncbi:hypothetical protein ACHHYP_01815 [Achlya hypogyna]|uniref:Ubiquitin-like domain-containing protein n=1 Tax=Achlya hypogyna TaxID=1202772 RepID=A0A1V9Z7X2_ACHHY|nr:hypothetical protein ACHHYP_01815 [Achlya hypogyna]